MRAAVSLTLPQFSSRPEAVMDAAERAEALGFQGVFAFDLFYPPWNRETPVMEAMATVSAAASVTHRVLLGTLVLRAPARPSWWTAQSAWSVQAASGGRLVLGLGAADSRARSEFAAYGLSFSTMKERVESVAATIDALSRPQLALPGVARPEVWVGGCSQAARRLAASRADGWNCWEAPVEDFRRDAAWVRARAGRPFTISWAGRVRLDNPDQVAERLSGYLDAGADQLVLTLLPSGDPELPGRFVEWVRPTLG